MLVSKILNGVVVLIGLLAWWFGDDCCLLSFFTWLLCMEEQFRFAKRIF